MNIVPVGRQTVCMYQLTTMRIKLALSSFLNYLNTAYMIA